MTCIEERRRNVLSTTAFHILVEFSLLIDITPLAVPLRMKSACDLVSISTNISHYFPYPASFVSSIFRSSSFSSDFPFLFYEKGKVDVPP